MKFLQKNTKQSILIFEGPDRTGKSHIAGCIAEKLSVPYFKASNEHQSYLENQDDFLMHLRYADPRVVDLLKQTKQSIVFDRAYPSEMVYSQVFGRKTDMKALTFVDEMFASMGTWIVVCHRSSYEGIQDDLRPETDENVLKELDAAYWHFLRWTKCKHMMLNVDDEDLKREVNDVMFMINQ